MKKTLCFILISIFFVMFTGLSMAKTDLDVDDKAIFDEITNSTGYQTYDGAVPVDVYFVAQPMFGIDAGHVYLGYNYSAEDAAFVRKYFIYTFRVSNNRIYIYVKNITVEYGLLKDDTLIRIESGAQELIPYLNTDSL